jgi:hypothetical protein
LLAQGSWRDPDLILSGFLGLRLKSEWQPPWPHNSCILNACQTVIFWTTLRFAARFRSSWDPLEHGCNSFWMPGWMNTVNKS